VEFAAHDVMGKWPAPTPAQPPAGEPDGAELVAGSPRDTSARRLKAKAWLTAFIDKGKHRDRNSTLKEMRAAHPGLTIRGSFALWGEFARANPELHLSRRGRKSKRNPKN
jgi:hypothetical protein